MRRRYDDQMLLHSILVACCLIPTLLAQSQLPNIVIVLADDLGYGDPTCYQAESKIPTPNIDRLAGEGMRFTDAHTPSSVCSPTRYGLLTGRYAWRTELKRGVLAPWDRPLIEADRLTLPAMLKTQGYATACIGKWHLGWEWQRKTDAPDLPEIILGRNIRKERVLLGQWIDFERQIGEGPITRGFDHYFGDDVPNYPPYTFIEDDRVVSLPSKPKPKGMFGNPGPAVEDWDLSAVMPTLADRAVAWLDDRAEDKETPFFLYMPLTAPHTPIAPLKRFKGKSRAGPYGDFVYQVDWTLGRVLKALDRNGQSKNTIVIFTSDNGSPMRNGKRMSGPTGSLVKDFAHNPSGPLRGMKGDIWEGGHRVPFVVRWPGKVAASTKSKALICLTDLFRTFAAIAKKEIPATTAEDSCDLLPLWRDHTKAGRESIVHHALNGTFALRKGHWKLITNNLGSGGFTQPTRVRPMQGQAPGQLYDLSKDLGETDNRYAAESERVDDLLALLKEKQGS